ncbi:hypothetical protein ACFX2G_029204 [Malus domestica]
MTMVDPAAHHDDFEAEPLDFQTQPLLHVVLFVDLVRRLGLLERLGEVVGLGDGEIVDIVLELLLDTWPSVMETSAAPQSVP